MNFWKELHRPFFALAPMEDVTDTVFREIVLSTAAPEKLHMAFTEFLSVDGFLHDKGKAKVKHRLYVSDNERELLKTKGIKLIVQVWGADPEKFLKAAREISTNYKFDGIDINMGCPVGKIISKKACSALIQYPELAKEIIIATKEGTTLPVSVKTRTGFHRVQTEEWMQHLLDTKPAAISLHGRTRKMMSEGEADWAQIAKAAEIRDSAKSDTIIVGNGDVDSVSDGKNKADIFGADGVMIGRGIFKDPKLFAASTDFPLPERLQMLKNHIERFREEWEGVKNYAILKRFYKIYINSFEGAGDLRAKLMETKNYDEAFHVLQAFKKLEIFQQRSTVI